MIQNDYLVDIKIITMGDGLEHNYFSYISWSNDNSYPVGNASLVTLFDNNIFKYWNSYHNIVIISAEIKNDEKINTNSSKYNDIITQHYKTKIKHQQLIDEFKKKELKKKGKKQHHTMNTISKLPKNNRIINNEYNFSFIGTIKKINQRGKELIIKLEDVGWKFEQYVPKDFRDKYVANQKLDDVFQAICEFMGIDFAYSIEDLNQYTFSSDGYSIQKDGQTIEKNPTIEEEFNVLSISDSTIRNNESEQNSDDNTNTENNSENQSTDSSISSKAINENNKKTSANAILEVNESDNISCQDKINKYQDEFEQKIRDLFIGNSYYESDLVSNILNYNQITIQPSSSSSSSITEINNNNNNNNNNNQNENNSDSNTQNNN